MMRLIFVFLCFVSMQCVGANKQTCNDIGLQLAYRPIDAEGVTACFVYTKTTALKEGQLSVDPDGVALYSVSESQKPELIYEFLYAGTNSDIRDAFIAPVSERHDRRLFVIHRIDAPSSWDAVNDVYEVLAVKFENGSLILDDKISRFFDAGGDLVDSQGKPIYIYPYKDKKSIEKVISSSLFKIINPAVRVKGVIREKTFLYEGNYAPAIQSRSKMYLIKGDPVVLKDSVAGWCKIFYAGKTSQIEKWVQCQAIIF